MADDYQAIKDKFDGICKSFDKLCQLAALVGNYSGEIDKIKGQLDGLAPKLASSDAWGKAEKSDQDLLENLSKTIDDLTNQLLPSPINKGMEKAKNVKNVCAFGLAALFIVYIVLHFWTHSSMSANKTGMFYRNLGFVKGTLMDRPVCLKDVKKAFDGMTSAKDNAYSSEFSDRINMLRGIVATFPICSTVSPLNAGCACKLQNTTAISPSPSIRQKVTMVAAEVNGIESDAKNLSVNDSFFWNTGWLKWLEIIFWGEFGVIVGILSWVATRVEQGKYTIASYQEEINWYWTEVVIGPPVVLAVFFLLRQSTVAILSGITAEQVHGSIYLALGISFTLGLFIRRTLGIFNVIKSKLPLPSGQDQEQKSPNS